MRSRLSGVSRLVSHLRHYRIENKGLKLLALLVAFLLFAVSRPPTRDVLLVGVPLEFRGLAPGMEIGGDVAQTVSVRLRGPQDVVRSILPSQIAVTADLSDKEPGERVVQLKAADVSRPDRVEVLRIEPASIKLRIEPTTGKPSRSRRASWGKWPPGMSCTASSSNRRPSRSRGHSRTSSKSPAP
jgi:hypothetical protein